MPSTWLTTFGPACRANFRLFVLETIITVLGEYVSEYFKIQAVLLLLVNGTMFYTIVRTLPYYSKSINNFQVMFNKHLSLCVHHMRKHPASP